MRKIINYLKTYLFQFIMIMANLLIFLFYIFCTEFYPLKYKLLICFLAIIPLIVYIILSIFKYKSSLYKEIRRKINVISVILIFVFWFLQIYIFGLALICELDGFEINQKYYSKYVEDSHLLKVFPKNIPSTAKNVSFYKDSFSIILYYVDETLNIEDINRKYPNVEWKGYKDSYYEKEGLLTGSLYDKKIDYDSNKKFKVYLIDGKCDDSGYCNHGVYWIMAFNEETKEVVYKFSNW